MTSHSLRYRPQIAAIAALALSASMWFYFQGVLIPHQRALAAATGVPRGNLSDLYPRWLGARELLLHHRDPYSPEITREIQSGYYGRVLDATRASDPRDQQAFAYPAYVILLLAPTVHWRFATVQAGFRWFLLILTAASVLMWLRALRWRPTLASTAVLVILTLGSYAAVQGLKLQQLSLLVSGLIAGCIVLLSAGYLFLAGILLALATIKPQLTVLLVVWLVVWAMEDWKSRQSFLWGFFLSMALLASGAELLLPGWISRFRLAVLQYRQYTGPSLLEILVTRSLSGILAALVLIALATLCWRMRREPADSNSFFLVVATILAITTIVAPMFAPYNQLLLLPGIFLALRSWRQLRSSWPGRFVSDIAVVVIGWPWLASAGLSIASFFLPSAIVQHAWALPLYTSLAIPLAVVALLIMLAIEARREKGKNHAVKQASLALPSASL